MMLQQRADVLSIFEDFGKKLEIEVTKCFASIHLLLI